jgi:hypothetical protein
MVNTVIAACDAQVGRVKHAFRLRLDAAKPRRWRLRIVLPTGFHEVAGSGSRGMEGAFEFGGL